MSVLIAEDKSNEYIITDTLNTEEGGKSENCNCGEIVSVSIVSEVRKKNSFTGWLSW